MIAHVDLAPDQLRCWLVLTSTWAPHNIPSHNRHGQGEWAIEWHNDGQGCTITLLPGVSLATYDADHLTRLVKAAHHHRVRLDIDATRNGRLRLMLHARHPDGPLHRRHPGPEALS